MPEAPLPTAFASALSDLGLDVHNLPPLERLEPRVLRGVMGLFARALGARCSDCHDERAASFAAPTRRKKIATRMWNEFLVKLAPTPTQTNGSAMFCDSCHAGHVQWLDRRDKRALAAWMESHFVAKLVRRDGKDHGCETCHVDMDMTFLSAWGR
jgi:formate-dependent nitrite reductase cytochrome c552 subunit